MNSNTRDALMAFVDEVCLVSEDARMAAASSHPISSGTGYESARHQRLLKTAEALKQQLDSDETIV